MEALTLTAKELLFCASHLGALTFFGLPDPFYGMDETEIAREIAEIQLALHKKGYASLGFDDAFKLSAGAEELISVCAECDRYISADLYMAGGRRERLLFYHRGEEYTAEILAQGDAYVLQYADAGEIADRLWAASGQREESPELVMEEIEIPFVELSEASRLALEDRGGAAALLRGVCADGSVMEILLDSFTDRSDYLEITVTDLRLALFEPLICLRSPAGWIRIDPIEDENGGRLRISPMDSGKLRRLLDGFCDRSGAKKEGDQG